MFKTPVEEMAWWAVQTAVIIDAILRQSDAFFVAF
jgi:hypothetical protein